MIVTRLSRWLIAACAALLLPFAAARAEAPCPPYEVTGTGPDLVLVPGLGASPETWSAVKERLARDHRLHLVHIAGFAGRPADGGDGEAILARAEAEIVRHLDCVGVARAAYAGHSLGGFLGLMLAADHPDRLSRVVVVDALPFFPLIFDPAATPASAAPQAAALRAQILGADAQAFAAGQAMGARSLVQSPARQAEVARWTVESDRTSFAAALHGLMTTDLRPRLAGITAPVRVLIAANAFAPRARVEPLYAAAYEAVPDLGMSVIEESYHFIMFDQPEAFAAALTAALAD